MTANRAHHGTLVFFGLALAFAVAMLGTTLPTPLYSIYQDRLGFSELMITVIYAVYAAGVIAALLVPGSWSDQIGRRPMLAIGLVFSAASALVFIWGGALVPLLIGRLLSGFSAGIFTGTATAAVVELAPRRWQPQATLVATAANMGGLGIGPLLAGILAEYAPAPLLLCFVVDLGLVGLSFVALHRAPETARLPDRPRLSISRPSLPPEVHAVFIPAVIAGAGQGIAFRAGMGAIAEVSPPEHRAAVASTFFVVAYVAISIPVIGLGLLARAFDLVTAGLAFAAMVALLSLVSAVLLLARSR